MLTSCDSGNCKNNGTCEELASTRHRCNCQNGFIGHDCGIGIKGSETKPYLRERILGEPILMKGCVTSILIHFNSVLVFYSVHNHATAVMVPRIDWF